MPQGQDGVFPHHARPGIAHHGFDLFAALRLVAMHRTIGAGRFAFAETAAFQTDARIIEQTLARRAELGIWRIVMIAAIADDHRLNCFQLTPQSWTLKTGCLGACLGRLRRI